MAKFGVSPWATADWGGPPLSITPSSYESILDPGAGAGSRGGARDVRLRPTKRRSLLDMQLEIRNKIAAEQLKQMRDQAREQKRLDIEARGARLGEPYRQQKRSPSEILRDKIGNEQLKKLREEAANRAAVVRGVGRNALGNLGAYKAGRVAARGMFTGGPTGRASINPYGSDPGISASRELPLVREAQEPVDPYLAQRGTPLGPKQPIPSWMQGMIRPQPKQTFQDTRSILGGREKGGTVPKTGPYELHKGEIVVSADQVDGPLLHALKTDKLKKMNAGQMDGKGTGPGRSLAGGSYREGTMGGYQGGTLEDIMRFLYDPNAEAQGGWLSGYERNPIQGMSPAIAASRGGARETTRDIAGALESLGAAPEIVGIAAPPQEPPPSASGVPGMAFPDIPFPTAPGGESLEALAAPEEPFQGIETAAGKRYPVASMSDEEYERSERKAKYVRDKMDTERDKEAAVKNNMQADRLDRYLAGNASNMDQAQWQQMTQQSARLRKSAETTDKRMEERKTVETVLAADADKAIADYRKAVDVARLEESGKIGKYEREQLDTKVRDLTDKYDAYSVKFSDGKIENEDAAKEKMAKLNMSIADADDSPMTLAIARILVEWDLGIIDDDRMRDDLAGLDDDASKRAIQELIRRGDI